MKQRSSSEPADPWRTFCRPDWAQRLLANNKNRDWLARGSLIFIWPKWNFAPRLWLSFALALYLGARTKKVLSFEIARMLVQLDSIRATDTHLCNSTARGQTLFGAHQFKGPDTIRPALELASRV